MRRAGLAAALWLAGCSAAVEPLPRLYALPDFQLTAVSAEAGPRPFSAEALRGRPWVAGFLFTNCAGPCPMIAARLAALDRDLPQEAGVVAFSVDPERDTPQALRRYAKRFGARGDRWSLVTGEKARIDALLRDGFRLAVAPGQDGPVHSAKLALVDGNGVVRGYYDSDDRAAIRALKRDLKRLLEGA